MLSTCPYVEFPEICHISRGSVWRITKERVVSSKKCKERAKTGPSPKLSARQRRLLLRKIVHLREREGNSIFLRLTW